MWLMAGRQSLWSSPHSRLSLVGEAVQFTPSHFRFLIEILAWVMSEQREKSEEGRLLHTYIGNTHTHTHAQTHTYTRANIHILFDILYFDKLIHFSPSVKNTLYRLCICAMFYWVTLMSLSIYVGMRACACMRVSVCVFQASSTELINEICSGNPGPVQ